MAWKRSPFVYWQKWNKASALTEVSWNEKSNEQINGTEKSGREFFSPWTILNALQGCAAIFFGPFVLQNAFCTLYRGGRKNFLMEKMENTFSRRKAMAENILNFWELQFLFGNEVILELIPKCFKVMNIFPFYLSLVKVTSYFIEPNLHEFFFNSNFVSRFATASTSSELFSLSVLWNLRYSSLVS